MVTLQYTKDLLYVLANTGDYRLMSPWVGMDCLGCEGAETLLLVKLLCPVTKSPTSPSQSRLLQNREPISWEEIRGRSNMWPASKERFPRNLCPPAEVQAETAAPSPGGGRKVPAQLPEVGGLPERGCVGGRQLTPCGAEAEGKSAAQAWACTHLAQQRQEGKAVPITTLLGKTGKENALWSQKL